MVVVPMLDHISGRRKASATTIFAAVLACGGAALLQSGGEREFFFGREFEISRLAGIESVVVEEQAGLVWFDLIEVEVTVAVIRTELYAVYVCICVCEYVCVSANVDISRMILHGTVNSGFTVCLRFFPVCLFTNVDTVYIKVRCVFMPLSVNSVFIVL